MVSEPFAPRRRHSGQEWNGSPGDVRSGGGRRTHPPRPAAYPPAAAWASR